METPLAPVEVFYSFAEADVPLLKQLERHLSVLQREGSISTWHKRQVVAGSTWQVEIDRHLNTASLILLLISSDFLASDYCYGTEMRQALQRHEAKEALVIPILLRSCVWQGTPFAALEVLPTTAKPITMWGDRDAAWTDVVKGIRRALGIEMQDAPGTAIPWQPPWDIAVLPQPPATGLVGRNKEQQWLEERVLAGHSTSVWAFAGIGGIGKTALAAALVTKLSPHFTGGVGVIRANDISDPTMILRQLVGKFVPNSARLLVQCDTTTKTLPSILTDALARALDATRMRGERALVVIDNVEPELLAELKTRTLLGILRATRVSVVLTAREEPPSGLVTESLPLEMLDAAAARDLFMRLANRPPYDDKDHEMTAIGKRLGGHALAIVVAAAELNQHPMETLAAYHQRLERSGSILDLVSPDAPDGVVRAFASSFEHLQTGAQRLFTALGTLAGPGCAVAAALALGAARGQKEVEARANLETLIRSKLLAKARTLTVNAHDRLDLHPLVHQFAAKCLAKEPSAEANRLRDALAEHYATWAQKISDRYIHNEDGFTGASEAAAFLQPDDTNLIAALEWTRDSTPKTDTTLAKLAYGLRWYWWVQGQMAKGMSWLASGYEAFGRLGTDWHQQQGKFAYALGYQHDRVGKTAEAENYYTESLARAREMQARQLEGITLRGLGDWERRTGNIEAARAYYAESLTICQEVRDRQGEGTTLHALGDLALDTKKTKVAKDYYTRSLVIRREVLDLRGEGITLRGLGNLAERQGEFDQAEDHFRERLETARKVKATVDIAASLEGLGTFLIEHHGQEGKREGCAMLTEAIGWYRHMGRKRDAARAEQRAWDAGCEEGRDAGG